MPTDDEFLFGYWRSPDTAHNVGPFAYKGPPPNWRQRLGKQLAPQEDVDPNMEIGDYGHVGGGATADDMNVYRYGITPDRVRGI